jgi:hypothetical protein
MLATPQQSASPPPNPDPQTLEPHQRVRVALSQILRPQLVASWISFPADFANMIRAGLDPDLDIVHCIKDLRAVRGDRFVPRSLSYAFNAVVDWHERRTGVKTSRQTTGAPPTPKEPPPELRPVRDTNPHYDLDAWREFARDWQAGAPWEHWHDGHPPDHPDSFVPLKICQELGIQRRPKPAAQPPADLVNR